MKVTHTHRGHCQVCLHVHAIDVQTGRLAKHGYTVAHGFFSGQCPGSDELSLHVERKTTDEIIARYRRQVQSLRAKATSYESGLTHPSEAWSGDYERVEVKTPRGASYMSTQKKMVPFQDARPVFQEEAILDACRDLRREASNYEDNANQMEKWAKDIFDEKRPAYRNEEFDNGEWKVGDTIRVGGKKGVDVKIEAIENKDYRTYGFSRRVGIVSVPHALVTLPAIAEKRSKDGRYVYREAQPERKIWQALRTIKRPKVALVEALRSAGLID